MRHRVLLWALAVAQNACGEGGAAGSSCTPESGCGRESGTICVVGFGDAGVEGRCRSLPEGCGAAATCDDPSCFAALAAGCPEAAVCAGGSGAPEVLRCE